MMAPMEVTNVFLGSHLSNLGLALLSIKLKDKTRFLNHDTKLNLNIILRFIYIHKNKVNKNVILLLKDHTTVKYKYIYYKY